jgi:hypothetical protein
MIGWLPAPADACAVKKVETVYGVAVLSKYETKARFHAD